MQAVLFYIQQTIAQKYRRSLWERLRKVIDEKNKTGIQKLNQENRVHRWQRKSDVL